MKKQENVSHSWVKKNWTEIIAEKFQILELLVNDIKLSVLNVFKVLKETIDNELKEVRAMYE
jgi:hypothetical protein